jgi:hypothetical protein
MTVVCHDPPKPNWLLALLLVYPGAVTLAASLLVWIAAGLTIAFAL